MCEDKCVVEREDEGPGFGVGIGMAEVVWMIEKPARYNITTSDFQYNV